MLMNEETGEDLSIGGPTGLFSKALRDAGKKISVTTLRGMGLREESVWNEIISWCVELASSNAQDMLREMDVAGVTYKEGLATFSDSGGTHDLFVTHTDFSVDTVNADNILIATGSKPFRPGGVPFDGKRVFDSDSINTLGFLPKSIAITGSGIVAIEFAKIYRNLGADVTLIIRDKSPINALKKIGLDKDIAATLVADLVRSGIKIERGAQASSFDVPNESKDKHFRVPIKIGLTQKDGSPRPPGQRDQILCDAYLAAVGRKPNTANLNLPAADIQIDEYGGILVDHSLRATAEDGNVYAAGDVLGRPFLASTGVAQGVAAVQIMFPESSVSPVPSAPEEKVRPLPVDEDDEGESDDWVVTCLDRVDGSMASAGASFDPTSLANNPFAFPCGIWSSPEAAYYGLSLQQAQDLGIEAGEGIALYAECLRGRVFSPNGLLKLVFEKPAGRILGVHICGDDACELIHYGMELVKGHRTVTDVISNLYSAVTFHEMYRIAAEAGLDEAGARKRRAAAGKALAKKNRAKMSH